MKTHECIRLENRKMKIFYSKLEIKKYIYVGKKVITFETNDKLVKHSSDLGFNEIRFVYAHGEENIHFMLHQKNNST